MKSVAILCFLLFSAPSYADVGFRSSDNYLVVQAEGSTYRFLWCPIFPDEGDCVRASNCSVEIALLQGALDHIQTHLTESRVDVLKRALKNEGLYLDEEPREFDAVFSTWLSLAFKMGGDKKAHCHVEYHPK